MLIFRATVVVALLLGASTLAGCDKLTGAAEQKSADAEAIGYACRVSGKTPEDCMKENDSYNPSDILEGWKNGAEAVKAKAAIEGGEKPSTGSSGDKPTEDKLADKPADKPSEKPGEKMDKPAGDSGGKGADKDGKPGDKGPAH